MTNYDRRELSRRFTILLRYLLKMRVVQREQEYCKWRSGIAEQQAEIRSLLEMLPSNGPQHTELFDAAYSEAVRDVAVECEVPMERFQAQCPWTLEQAVSLEPSYFLARIMREG